jgi:predicted metal-dependent HD superfamily phosphohydrolase
MLKEIFITLLLKYTDDNSLVQTLWAEIEKSYTHKKRHYHSLKHLENMLQQLNEIKDKIQNWDAVLFSLFYHDIVYNVLRSDNEAKSAAVAEKRMNDISVPASTIEACSNMILATAAHNKSADEDTNYFTDADLAVLGQDWKTYSEYYNNIRKEYAVYPNLVYNPGRKKVLTHFLGMDSIYKTDHFHNKFEMNAKENLQKELELL